MSGLNALCDYESDANSADFKPESKVAKSSSAAPIPPSASLCQMKPESKDTLPKISQDAQINSLVRSRYVSKRERQQLASLKDEKGEGDLLGGDVGKESEKRAKVSLSNDWLCSVPLSFREADKGHGFFLPRHSKHQWKGHSTSVVAIRWMGPHGSKLASASLDGRIVIWDAFESRAILWEDKRHTNGVKDIQFDWNHRMLSCGLDKTIRLVDLQHDSIHKVFTSNDQITCLRFHPRDGNIFLAGGSNTGITSWDLRSGCVARKYKAPFGQVQDIEFLRDGNEFISSADVLKRNSIDKGIIVWDYQSTVALSNQVYTEAFTCYSIRAHPRNNQFVAQSNGNYIAIFSSVHPYKMNKNKRFEGHSVSGYKVRCNFSRDGDVLASGSSDGKIFFYDSQKASVLRSFNVYDSACMDVIFHPEMRYCASCSWDGDISLWV